MGITHSRMCLMGKRNSYKKWDGIVHPPSERLSLDDTHTHPFTSDNGEKERDQRKNFRHKDAMS